MCDVCCSAGFLSLSLLPSLPRSVLHIHTLVEECEVTKLLYAVDMKTKEQKKVGESVALP